MEYVYREALLGIARKNGKSTFGAGIALYGLVAAGENAPEVYAAAGSVEQGRIVFGQAQRFVEASPRLQDWLRVYRSTIECKSNGGIFKVLSADGPLQHGLNPSTVVIDELWAHKNPELYYALTTGGGARENPLVVVITTAGWDRKSVCYQVFQHGEALASQGIGAMRNERFYHRWMAAGPTAAIDDRMGWLDANPSTWINFDELDRERRRLPGNVFRRLHMNQWTETEEAWIAPHEWDALVGRPLFDPAKDTYMAVDVGVRRDSAAITWGQWWGDKLHTAQRILLPEHHPEMGVADVRAALAEEAQRLKVVDIAYDPWAFRESAEILQERGLPMVEFPQSAGRMAPASESLYELIIANPARFIHDDDLEMRSQVLAAVAAPTDRGGWRISKRKSKERIDGAVSLAMMADRAVTLRNAKPQPRGAAFM
jgi:phage terminase large subunit-like protein